MLEQILEKFPVRITLGERTPCSILPMSVDDRAAFQGFHEVIPERERLFVRSQIKDGSLFDQWMANPEALEHLVLLAFVDGKMVALGSLHQRLGGWKRHIGRVHLLTHPAYAGLGLIDELLKILMEVAQECGLTKLESELNGERKTALAAMARIGFRELARIPDYIQDMDAGFHDYVLMGADLVASYENLGAGD